MRTSSSAAVQELSAIEWAEQTAQQVERLEREPTYRLPDPGPIYEVITKWRTTRTARPGPEWRKAVMRRDDGTCQKCGGFAAHAHHVNPVSIAPELAADIDNGIALCKQCHATAHGAIKRRLFGNC